MSWTIYGKFFSLRRNWFREDSTLRMEFFKYHVLNLSLRAFGIIYFIYYFYFKSIVLFRNLVFHSCLLQVIWNQMIMIILRSWFLTSNCPVYCYRTLQKYRFLESFVEIQITYGLEWDLLGVCESIISRVKAIGFLILNWG